MLISNLKKEKCSFGFSKVPFLGFMVGNEGITTNPEKIAPIATYPRPTTEKELRAFNGLANYYHPFIEHITSVIKPLYALSKKKVPLQSSDAAI